MNIGEKIKELRCRNDLTQEKLADYLCISPQAVSKWECGIASPDLAMIAPLTKLLHVSADELLGLVDQDVDMRAKELEEAYQGTWKTGDMKVRYDVCANAVAEYPGDMKWLDRLAWTEALRSFDFADDEVYAAEQEKAIKKFARVIEDCKEPKIRNSSIWGIVQYLVFRGRNDEAQKYAELYPEDDEEKYNQVMGLTLRGDERLAYEQKVIERALQKFMSALSGLVYGTHHHGDSPFVYDVILRILAVIFPDGNYLDYHCFARDAYKAKAGMYVKEGKLDQAMDALQKAHYHICEYDKIDHVGNTAVLGYTTQLFDRLTIDTSEFVHSGGDSTYEEDFLRLLCQQPQWEPLREREDFKTLVSNQRVSYDSYNSLQM